MLCGPQALNHRVSKTLTVEDHHSYSVLEHELVLLITQQRCQEFIKRQMRTIASFEAIL